MDGKLSVTRNDNRTKKMEHQRLTDGIARVQTLGSKAVWTPRPFVFNPRSRIPDNVDQLVNPFDIDHGPCRLVACCFQGLLGLSSGRSMG